MPPRRPTGRKLKRRKPAAKPAPRQRRSPAPNEIQRPSQRNQPLRSAKKAQFKKQIKKSATQIWQSFPATLKVRMRKPAPAAKPTPFVARTRTPVIRVVAQSKTRLQPDGQIHPVHAAIPPHLKKYHPLRKPIALSLNQKTIPRAKAEFPQSKITKFQQFPQRKQHKKQQHKKRQHKELG